jgi:single-stranded-DNA-specific exonuclease
VRPPGGSWQLPPADRDPIARLAAALGIDFPAAAVLFARQLSDPSAARRFLDPSLDQLHDPWLLAGMPEAVARLSRACAAREKILLYGDYDVDGTLSVVLLEKAISLAGGAAQFHVPHRIKEGYGMLPEVVEAAAARGVSLIVSVDTGIRAGEVVRGARERGVDVIITDHHLPEAALPPAVAVLNPNRLDCPYPNKHLCGAGVAFKLAQALLAGLNWEPERLRRITASLMKLAAIATVADVAPLTGENRAIVKHGLAGLRSVANPGLKALLAVAGFAGRVPSATDVAFRIAPRINAAGRMAGAAAVIDLFQTPDESNARRIAESLDALNAERQQAEVRILAEILERCESRPIGDEDAALVFSASNWHRGVLGIVASRLLERFQRPVFVLSEEEAGMAYGSGRGVPGFHLLEALESMPELFEKFGGHKQAAGLTIPSAQVAEFRRRLNAFAAERLTPADRVARLAVDAVIELDDIHDRSVAGVLALAPFGYGNPAPCFAVLNVTVARAPTVMKEKHLRIPFLHGGRPLWVKAWNFAERAAELAPGRPVDVVLRFEEDLYAGAAGEGGWSAILRDVRPSSAAEPLRASVSA